MKGFLILLMIVGLLIAALAGVSWLGLHTEAYSTAAAVIGLLGLMLATLAGGLVALLDAMTNLIAELHPVVEKLSREEANHRLDRLERAVQSRLDPSS